MRASFSVDGFPVVESARAKYVLCWAPYIFKLNYLVASKAMVGLPVVESERFPQCMCDENENIKECKQPVT